MFGTIRLIQRLKVHRPSKHAESWPNKADGLNLKLEEQMVSSLCLLFFFHLCYQGFLLDVRHINGYVHSAGLNA